VVYAHDMALPRLFSHAIPSIMAVTGALMPEPWGRAHKSRIGVLLGDASYSIYLIHPFAQRAFLLAIIHTIGLPNINPTVYIFSAFFIALVAGTVCHLVLERRVLRVGRRLMRLVQPTRCPDSPPPHYRGAGGVPVTAGRRGIAERAGVPT